MWNYKEGDLVKEGNDKDKIEKSGVYSFKIKEARMINSTSSAAKAVQLHFEDEYGYISANLWHIKGNGEPNEFTEAKLNQLLFLCKLKIDQIKTEKKEMQGKNGAYAIYSIKAFEGKEVAVALEFEKGNDEDYDKIEIKEFFEIKSKKTTKEIKEKTDANKWKYYTEKYKNVPKAKEETKTNSNEAVEVDDDDFPF